MDILVGKTLDQVYRIDRRLRRGGMGSVYKGHDTSLDRDVAIKVMHPQFTDDPTFCERFRQEARAVASLRHPGIVQVYACGQDLDMLYIAMDYVEGQTLNEWLKRLADQKKIVALEESLRIVRAIAMALHYAHEAGVLHRDIKPSNVILRPVDPALQEPGGLPFQPVLTDFGLAQLAEGGVRTQTGMTMGTPAYMSPEQCLGEKVDRRSDIYSLGIVLYELTTGRVPFDVKSLTEAMRYHVQEPPPPPRSIHPALPIEVENIILCALAKRQEDRYPTARAMADALRDAIARLPSGLVISLAKGPPASGGGSGDAAGDDGPDTEVSGIPFHGDLTVTFPGGRTQHVEMGDKGSLSIGRTPDNDLVLSDAKISRHHARIEVDGNGLRVTDLHSTNGTFLGETRLLPGVAASWGAGQPLLFGEISIQWRARAVAAVVRMPSPDETVLEGTSAHTYGGQISVSRSQFALDVDPGERVSTAFVARNAGPRVDHLETTVEGVPGSWVVEQPPVVQLLPNDQRELSVSFSPPKLPESVAGSYPIAIRIQSQADPAQITEIRGTLRVLPYFDWDVDMEPRKVTGTSKGAFEVQLTNRGNAELDVQLEASDPEAGCLYTFSPRRALVPPGAQQAVELSVEPRLPLPSETTRTYVFTVTARAPAAPVPVREVQGQWIQAVPQFEASLHPAQQTSAEEARLRVQVTNQSLADLDVSLEVSDETGSCQFACEPKMLTVSAAGEKSATLTARSRQPLYGKEPVRHAILVQVQPVNAPRFARQLQGEWVQIPTQRSLWPPALLILLGWLVAWFAFFAVSPDLTLAWIEPLLELTGAPWQIAEIGAWGLRGIILGLLGGLATGLGLRWADRAVAAGRVLWLTVVWGLVWGAGVASVPVTALPFVGGSVAVLFWVIVGTLAGLVGGLFTGGAVPGASAFIIALGWVLGWGVGLLVGESLVQSGIVEQMDGSLRVLQPASIALVGVSIAATVMFAQIRRAHRPASA
jgi:serine/threonine protein kinase/uncharacterized membrane protein